MKKLVRSVVLAAALATMAAVPTLAAAGGVPAAHGVDGRTFGALVSQLAQSSPGAVADHVSGR